MFKVVKIIVFGAELKFKIELDLLQLDFKDKFYNLIVNLTNNQNK